MKKLILLLSLSSGIALGMAQPEPALFEDFMQAIQDNNLGEVKKLIERKAVDVNESFADGQTPLMYAALSDREAIFEYLLKKGANPHATDNSGQTVLMMAVGNKKIVESLIKRGVDINARDEEGRTALRSAILAGKPEIVKLLLEHGADATIVTKDGATLLDLAVGLKEFFSNSPTQKRNYLRIINMLQEKVMPSEIE